MEDRVCMTMSSWPIDSRAFPVEGATVWNALAADVTDATGISKTSKPFSFANRLPLLTFNVRLVSGPCESRAI